MDLFQYASGCYIFVFPVASVHVTNRDALAAGAMDDFLVARIDRDVADRFAVRFVEDKIAHAEGAFVYFGAHACLCGGCARQPYLKGLEYVLGKGGAVEGSGASGFCPELIRGADKFFAGCDELGRSRCSCMSFISGCSKGEGRPGDRSACSDFDDGFKQVAVSHVVQIIPSRFVMYPHYNIVKQGRFSCMRMIIQRQPGIMSVYEKNMKKY